MCIKAVPAACQGYKHVVPTAWSVVPCPLQVYKGRLPLLSFGITRLSLITPTVTCVSAPAIYRNSEKRNLPLVTFMYRLFCLEFVVLCCFVLEAGLHFVALANQELEILLPQPLLGLGFHLAASFHVTVFFCLAHCTTRQARRRQGPSCLLFAPMSIAPQTVPDQQRGG